MHFFLMNKLFNTQMVAPEETQTSEKTDNTGAFNMIRQTLSSSLQTAKDNGKFVDTMRHTYKIGSMKKKKIT